ncbi:23S rRNA methyltransferase [Actinomadura craniellae]|uniref:23S rRNA methyltransferase n=1 Tax=Actinomadura craniellae TaxID=2231787 RepID=A0A365HAC0_9ACTN|nr:methyltransferase domain-containing protein [Actinomadura craniellae]RAY16045.1 23S rRNA methyltransferase [Actinomadura craniellae]
MLNDIVDLLRCPVCQAGLSAAPGMLRCPAGHAFDVARQGYVNLLPGHVRPGTADTADMVRARAEFLGAGRFGALTDLLADRVGGGCVVDAGAGTGHHLAAVLGKAADVTGVALDVSKHAMRRAARAHPRIGAVVADLWRPLPLRDAAADAVLNVFAPRNAAEFHRVLRPGGTLYVVTPTARHLGPLVEALGLLTVDPRKADRVGEALAGRFRREDGEIREDELVLPHPEVLTLVGMGPSAHHIPGAELRERVARLPDPVTVPVSFELVVYRAMPG